MEKTRFRLTCFAQKRLCLSPLITSDQLQRVYRAAKRHWNSTQVGFGGISGASRPQETGLAILKNGREEIAIRRKNQFSFDKENKNHLLSYLHHDRNVFPAARSFKEPGDEVTCSNAVMTSFLIEILLHVFRKELCLSQSHDASFTEKLDSLFASNSVLHTDLPFRSVRRSQ